MPGHAHPFRHGSDALTLSDLESGEAGTLHLFVVPGDVIDAKNRIQAKLESLRFDVQNCAKLTKEEKAAFADFYDGWRRFFCVNDSGTCTAPDYRLWGLGGQIDQCDTWEAEGYDWQKKVNALCPLSEPLTAPPAPAGVFPDMGWVQWAAIAAVAVGAVYVVKQTGLPRLWSGGKRHR
jgi:hypothetical protein